MKFLIVAMMSLVNIENGTRDIYVFNNKFEIKAAIKRSFCNI